MDKFGPNWRDHPARIAAIWHKLIGPDDLVLIAGDISWALRFPEALPDLEWIDALPGRKVLTKGNHDFWWDGARKKNAVVPPSLTLVEAQAVRVGDWVVCGTRGWVTPGQPFYKPEDDEKIYKREQGRLERALAAAKLLAADGAPIAVLLHFPPFTGDGTPTPFAEQLAAAGVTLCVYGHLHRRHDWLQAVQGVRDGVEYHLTSCDFLGFTPKLLRRE